MLRTMHKTEHEPGRSVTKKMTAVQLPKESDSYYTHVTPIEKPLSMNLRWNWFRERQKNFNKLLSTETLQNDTCA